MEYFQTRDQIAELLEQVRPVYCLEDDFDPHQVMNKKEVAGYMEKMHLAMGVPANMVTPKRIKSCADKGFMDNDHDGDGFVNFLQFDKAMKDLHEELLVMLANLGLPEVDNSAAEEAARRAYVMECAAKNAKGMELAHEHDFDRNGLVFWLGSKKENEMWSNPALFDITPSRNNDVVATYNMDPTTSCNGDVRHLLDRAGPLQVEPKTLSLTSNTGDVAMPMLWMCVDMGPTRELVPRKYTLRHSNQTGGELRNWNLEASCLGQAPGAVWDVLCEHIDDAALQGAASTATWAIKHPVSAYRYFRLVATGPDADGNQSLSCAGLELYGQFLRLDPDF